jgi:predicted SprT family Zn-dependent metalloprotease
VFFGSANNDRQAVDHKLCHYRCDCGQSEFKIRLEKGDRKLRRWCKSCRKFIYPIAITQITTTQRELRSTLPSWRR